MNVKNIMKYLIIYQTPGFFFFLIHPGIPQTCIQLSLQLNTKHSTSAWIHSHITVPDIMGPLQMLEALALPIAVLKEV